MMCAGDICSVAHPSPLPVHGFSFISVSCSVPQLSRPTGDDIRLSTADDGPGRDIC